MRRRLHLEAAESVRVQRQRDGSLRVMVGFSRRDLIRTFRDAYAAPNAERDIETVKLYRKDAA